MSSARSFAKSPLSVRYAFVLIRAFHLAIFALFFASLGLGGVAGPAILPMAIIGLVLALASQIFVVNIIGHRFIGHRNFSPSRPAQFLLLAWSVFAGLSSPLSSSLLHRRHHANPDTSADPHSPPLSGFKKKLNFFFQVFFNFFDEKNFSFREIRQQSRRPYFIFFHRYGAYLSFATSVVLFFTMGFEGVFFLQTVPVIICFWGQFNLVYQTHVRVPGSADQKNSVDSILANILTLGEGAHASHHAAPSKVFYPQDHPAMFDFTGFLIRSIWKKDPRSGRQTSEPQ